MTASLFQTIGSGVLVVTLMFAIGLKLETARVAELWSRPATLVWSVLVNVIVIPAITWALVLALGLSTEVAIGLLLCAAAPGGATSALYSNTARADLALAATMTIGLPAIGVVATPLILSLTIELPEGASVPVLPMAMTLLVLQLLPLAAGMLIRRRDSALARRLAPYASACANVTLGLLVVILAVVQGKVLLGITGPTWAAILSATAAALVLGYLAARTNKDSARAGALVAVCRNVAVSIMLASTFFIDPVVNATVLTFGLVSFVIPLGLSLWWRARPSDQLTEKL